MSLAERILRTWRFLVECKSKLGIFKNKDKYIHLQPSLEAAKRNLLQVASDEWCLGCPLINACWSRVDTSNKRIRSPHFMKINEVKGNSHEGTTEP